MFQVTFWLTGGHQMTMPIEADSLEEAEHTISHQITRDQLRFIDKRRIIVIRASDVIGFVVETR